MRCLGTRARTPVLDADIGHGWRMLLEPSPQCRRKTPKQRGLEGKVSFGAHGTNDVNGLADDVEHLPPGPADPTDGTRTGVHHRANAAAVSLAGEPRIADVFQVQRCLYGRVSVVA